MMTDIVASQNCRSFRPAASDRGKRSTMATIFAQTHSVEIVAGAMPHEHLTAPFGCEKIGFPDAASTLPHIRVSCGIDEHHV
jgi:hypothetical protein